MQGQANGIGSRISLAAIGTACLCAECIPVMIGATLIAVGGVVWDFARGHTTGEKAQKKRPARVGARSKAQAKNYSPIV